jgi:hypothetical protein
MFFPIDIILNENPQNASRMTEHCALLSAYSPEIHTL